MKVKELEQFFKTVNPGDGEREITGVFCCDLLSIAMGKAPAGSAWVTVMSNVNTLAVASLTDVACVLLAENVALDEKTAEKAVKQDIAVFRSDRPVFETALAIHGML